MIEYHCHVAGASTTHLEKLRATWQAERADGAKLRRKEDENQRRQTSRSKALVGALRLFRLFPLPPRIALAVACIGILRPLCYPLRCNLTLRLHPILLPPSSNHSNDDIITHFIRDELRPTFFVTVGLCNSTTVFEYMSSHYIRF